MKGLQLEGFLGVCMYHMYKYTISRGGQTVKGVYVDQPQFNGNWLCYLEPTVPGSACGQVSLKLEPGEYRVTVQDLDAGNKDYITLNIRTSQCKVNIILCPLLILCTSLFIPRCTYMTIQ